MQGWKKDVSPIRVVWAINYAHNGEKDANIFDKHRVLTLTTIHPHLKSHLFTRHKDILLHIYFCTSLADCVAFVELK